jgi:CRP-like cAMP-binding protein
MLADTVKELLASSELFRDLPEESLRRLAESASEAHFAVGDVLFRRGDPGDTLHIILAGVVQVDLGGDGDETVVAVLGPGECVGELSLIDGKTRSATVEALEPVDTVVLPRDDFLAVMRSHLPSMEALLVTVVERLRQSNALTADIFQLHLPA